MKDIQARNLSVTFKEKVFETDLDIQKNEFVSIIGDNGSGKSTLANALLGVIPGFLPGKVGGQLDIRTDSIGFVLQNPSSQFLAFKVRNEVRRIDDETLKKNGLYSLRNRNVFELSEGEKQKINLLNQLMSPIQTLILDEPLELLDPVEARGFLSIIRAFKGERTIIWLDKRQPPVKADKTISLKRRRPFRLGKKFRGRGGTVLDRRISFRRGPYSLCGTIKANEGEKIALIGRNGSGKTTLLKILCGLVGIWQSTKPSMAYCVQNPSHFLYEDKVSDEVKSHEMMEAFGIDGLKDNDPNKLSKGQQKMVANAAAFSTGADVLLLDEPTVWLDEYNRCIFYQNMMNSHKTMIIATHNPKVVSLCDRAYMIEDGEIRCTDTRQARQFFTD
ncbi:ATP-binding cassette domain-containing protein [Candidatus Woesearchaeota archaeon]|nr:ATP-binding cassette domain-containing protein [Candidatus Woesearchaeota archaeon]